MAKVKHRAVVMLCMSHVDGLRHLQTMGPEFRKLPVHYVFPGVEHKLRGLLIEEDVKVERTPLFAGPFTASQVDNANHIEELLKTRTRYERLEFVNADSVLYPVAGVVERLLRTEDGGYALSASMRLVFGLRVVVTAKAMRIYTGNPTLFLDGVNVEEAR